MGPRNPNFDPAIRMSWNQFHCKHYQILIPTTIHGSKSELKQLRYWENREKHISMLPEVITFGPTVGILIYLAFWKLDIQSFPGTPRSPQSEFEKTFKCASKVKTEKVQQDEFADVIMTSTQQPYKVRYALKSMPRAINSPWHLILDYNWKIGFLGAILGVF